MANERYWAKCRFYEHAKGIRTRFKIRGVKYINTNEFPGIYWSSPQMTLKNSRSCISNSMSRNVQRNRKMTPIKLSTARLKPISVFQLLNSLNWQFCALHQITASRKKVLPTLLFTENKFSNVICLGTYWTGLSGFNCFRAAFGLFTSLSNINQHRRF